LDAKEIQREVEIWWRFVPKRLRRRMTHPDISHLGSNVLEELGEWDAHGASGGGACLEEDNEGLLCGLPFLSFTRQSCANRPTGVHLKILASNDRNRLLIANDGLEH
jgi:hypothetical protein